MSGPSDGATQSFCISRLEELAPVRQWLRDQLDGYGYPPHDLFAIRTAFEEAATNAITHGNASDPAKCVHIDLSVCDSRVEMTVEDEGPGFDYTHVKDPTADENLCRAGGRGVMLIRAFMDEVHRNASGSRVRLVKYRSNRPGHASDDALSP
ncbi:MAG: ATP-binding protein [Verrucomicrobia bacterium]|nr:ATP-binding protein [Verrucomicrobiota bacterium]